MEETKAARSARGAQPFKNQEPPRWRRVLKALGIFLLVLFCGTAGAAIYINGKAMGVDSPNPMVWIDAANKSRQVLLDPRKYFPGQDQITVLCLGLDRNIYRSRDPKLNGMPYTKGARSDVMMVARLDLVRGTASILSIPRDTRVLLPGKRYHAKINQAHADGGIPYTRQAVEEFLGISIDHHVVIKQEAIEKIVDALGGVKLKVAKDMDYDDNWGQLHVHLKEGEQVLKGTDVVGYMRFRHDAEGDLGRIRRQQQVIQVLSEEVKDPSVLLKAAGLIDAVDRYITTSFTKEQRLALAHLFHKIQPANIQTVSLPIDGTDMIDGISYVIPDEFGKEAAVDWIINGNPDAMNRLVKVELRNASGDRTLYNQVYDCLRHYGFEVVRGGRESGDPQPTTRAVQLSNMRGAARRVLEVLGIRADVAKEDGDPWGPDVTLYVGQDLATNDIVSTPEYWPEAPVRPTRRRQARRSRSRDRSLVRVRAVEREEATTDEPAEEEAPVEAPVEQPLDVPGAADPPSPEPGAATTAPAPATATPSTPAAAPAGKTPSGSSSAAPAGKDAPGAPVL